MNVLKNDIKTKEFKKCYLLFGNEVFLKKTYESKLKEAINGKTEDLMNIEVFEDKKASVSKIIDACETLPFLAEKRVILVKESGLFQSGRKDDTEMLAEYAEKIPYTACIIFVESQVDKRNKLYKSVSSVGHCAELKTPSESELVKWVVSYFKKNKLNISSANAAYLLRTVGNGMETALKEMEKLISFKGKDSDILAEDIENVCTKSFEAKIFDMVGAIGNKDTKKALTVYRNLLFMKESPIMILSMITRQFRIIMQSGYLAKDGKSINEIAEITGQRDFVVRECLRQTKNFTFEILKNALDECLKIDLDIKTGMADAETAVEILIINYSSQHLLN